MMDGILPLLFLILGMCLYLNLLIYMKLSWLGLDIVIHFVMGFGLNEMYIMACHWIFIIPIAIAYLMKSLTPGRQVVLRYFCWLLTLYFWVWNGYWLFTYMSDQATQIMK